MITYSPSSVFLRNYDSVFTGSNQEYGHSHPYFGFEADTASQILKADNITYFHYPQTASTTPLSTIGLIEDGAIASLIPYNADKIWKKQANYQKYIWFGNASEPQIGTWLCAWLSGSPNNQNSVWMDRWYNPGYIDPMEAGLIPGYHINSPAVFDEPSQLTFEPGVWYRYLHIGDSYNQILVNSLTGNINNIGDNLLISHLDNWTNPMIDQSGYDNTIIIQNFQSNMIQTPSINENQVNDNCLYIQHGQLANILFNSRFNLTNNLTVATWAKAEDWNNVEGNQIIGRSLRGGWSIRFDNGFYNPTFSLMCSSDGMLIQGNSDTSIINSKVLPGSSQPKNGVVDQDLYTWIIDNGVYNGFKHLYKTDYEGTIELSVSLDSSAVLEDIVIDKDNNIWILDTSTNYASGFTARGTYISRTSLAGTNLDVTLQNTLTSLTCNDMCIDNNDDVWYVNSTGLYKNSTLIYSASTFYRMKCDSNNNFWIFSTPNNLLEFNSAGTLVLNKAIDDISSGICDISLTNEFNQTTKQYSDFVWIVSPSTQRIYKFDTVGSLVKTRNLAAFATNVSNKDFTSYDWNRKFNYLTFNKVPQIKGDIYVGTSTVPVCGRQTISFPVSSFNGNEWHHFALTYDSAGVFKFIVDSIERGTVNTTSGYQLFYAYENNVIIGAESGKIETLEKELNLNSLYFNGFIDDVRIYDSTLNSSNIWNIMMIKRNFHDLIWNMPTGMRNYLEEVERFFKFKTPGLKSQFYNIKLIGLQITDPDLRNMIENIIKQTVKRVAPLYTELYKIIWE